MRGKVAEVIEVGVGEVKGGEVRMMTRKGGKG